MVVTITSTMFLFTVAPLLPVVLSAIIGLDMLMSLLYR
jgi:hypothetical protein